MNPNVLVKINALDNTKEAFRNLSANLEQVGDRVSTARGKLEQLEPTFRKITAVGAVAFTAIAAAGAKSVQAYAEVERAQRQLEHAVLQVSKGTRDQVKEVEDITAALERKAGVDADSLKMGVAQLSTFGLQTKSVVALTKSLADLTVNQSGLSATSEDYIASANNIAKALNGQFGVLERSGIRFTEAQKNLILYGTETQKVAALQEGFAQNLRETTDTVAGVDLAMAKMRVTISNIQENVGKALAPAFADLAAKIQPIVERIAAWSEQNPELISKLLMIGAGVAALTVLVGTLALSLAVLLSPITLVVAGFAALVAGIYVVTQKWAELPLILQIVLLPLKLVIDRVTMLYETLAWVFNAIKEPVANSVAYMQETFGAFVDWLGGKVDYILDRVQDALDALSSLPGVKAAFKVTRSAFQGVSELITGRATGGPVVSRTPYMVGEQGPELFVPNQSGSIIPNGALAGVGTYSQPIYLTITGNTFMGEQDMVEQIGDRLIRIIKNNGRL